MGKVKQKNSTCLLKSAVKAIKMSYLIRGKIRVVDSQALIASLNVNESAGLRKGNHGQTGDSTSYGR